MSELAEDLVKRLRRIAAERPTTESEVRSVGERAGALADRLAEELAASESRLAELAADPDCSVAEAAEALRRVEAFRPALAEVRSLLEELDARARRLRTEWLLHQTAP